MPENPDIIEALRSILTQQGRVCLNGIGTFYTVYKAAQIEQKKGLIHPPSKSLHFRNSFDQNDQTLNKFLCKYYDLKPSIADRVIDRFVNEVRIGLIEKNYFKIDGFGQLIFDKKKNLDLISGMTNFNHDSYAFNSLRYHPLLKTEHAEVQAIPHKVQIESSPIVKKPKLKKKRNRLPLALASLLVLAWLVFAFQYYDSPGSDVQKIPTRINISPSTSDNVEETETELGKEANAADKIQEEEIISPVLDVQKSDEKMIESVVILYAFSQEAYIQKNKKRIIDQGYTYFEEKGTKFTRLGMTLRAKDENELNVQFQKIKSEFTQSAYFLN